MMILHAAATPRESGGHRKAGRAAASMLGARQLIVAGSLGKGNLGDERLVHAMVRQVGGDYGAVTILTEDPAESSGLGVDVDRPPPVAIGRRFWLGASGREGLRRRIIARSPGSGRDFAWLGGLLTADPPINRVRKGELAWARDFCSRFVYFFGDVHDGFLACPTARPIVRLIDGGESWVSVRSEEAADNFDLLGLKAEVRVGVDPVLHDLAVRLGWPFRRRVEPSATLAVIPCLHRYGLFRPTLLAAAVAGARRGLAIRWVSFCDREDLPLIRDLSAELEAAMPGHPQDVHRATPDDLGLDDAACCVAMRCHGAIFALALGLPTIGLAYDPKVRNLFRMFRLHDWIAPKPTRVRPEAIEGEMRDRLTAALDGAFAPQYREFGRRMAAHDAALVDLKTRPAAGP